MSKISTFFKLIRDDKRKVAEVVFLNFSFSTISHIVPDGLYLKWQYRVNLGKKLDLKNPVSFNEKLQWLKVHDRKGLYTMMVDKYEAKMLFSERFGKNHIIPTYGVWDSFDEIDFDSLPEQFVLKCTHDSGSIAICRDKNSFELLSAKEKLEKGLKRNGYWYAREWPYKDVKPRILAEKYMENVKNGKPQEMVDYKFYCFNGEPRYLYVSQGLENHETAAISFLTLDWEFAPFGRTDYRPFMELPEKPKKLDEMISIAKDVSQNIPFLRVDLYEINGEVYFSEFTFSPNGGYMQFKLKEWDEIIGELINISNI